MGISIGSVTLDDPVILAPMSGVSDLPFRRLVKRLGAGLVVSEMIASEAMIRETRQSMTMAKSCADEQPMAVQLAGCEPRVMAEAAKLNADRGRENHRHKFRLPGEKGGQRACRLRADARRGSCRANPRSNGKGGRPAGHLEDAHRMGRAQPQRAAARSHCRSLRHPHDQRARPHPLPALCRLGRLELHPPGQGSGGDPGHRQRRHHDLRRRRPGIARNPAPTD